MDKEIDQIDASGARTLLKPGELGQIPKIAKTVNLTLTFNYKRAKDGTVEERKSHTSVRSDQMQPDVHFNPEFTSAPMVDKMAARMVIGHNVVYGWQLEHLDVKSAFLHAEYRYGKPVYLREMARADGTFRHGKTVGILMLNLYGNHSETYYCIEGLLDYLRETRARLNEAKSCLICVDMPSGTIIAAMAIEDFLVTAQKPQAMEEFYAIMKKKYDIKRLGRPERYLK